MKILIVEDNELNMKLFYDILTFKKYDTYKAYTGLEAYEMIKNNEFNLIILDIQLPVMDGFSVLEKLKNEGVSIPKVIIASACAMDSDKLKAKEFGIENYITKPIDIKKFTALVEETMAE